MYKLVNRINVVVKTSNDKSELERLKDCFNMTKADWLESKGLSSSDAELYYQGRKPCIELLDDVGHAMYMPPFKVVEDVEQNSKS